MAALLSASIIAAACAGVDPQPDPGEGDASSACLLGTQDHPLLRPEHVRSNEGMTYSSSPPSSGPHCPSWAQHVVFPPEDPLPSCHWLHNLEHGALVLLYNCPQGCPDVVASLEAAMKDVADPDCPGAPRVVLTPDPTLDSQVAAVTWGHTWKASCFDAGARRALLRFATSHMGSRGRAPAEERTICQPGTIVPG